VGFKAVSVEGVLEKGSEHTPLECALESEKAGEPPVAVCTVKGLAVLAYDLIEMRVAVVLEAGAVSGELNKISVSGGGAPAASVSRPVTVSGSRVPFGVEDYELSPEEEGGGVDTQAGSHPFQTTFSVALNEAAQTTSGSGVANANPVGLARDLHDNFPAGLIGNPQPFARCTSAQFLAVINKCPAGSVIGVAVSTISEPGIVGTITYSVPVFNLEPAVGEPAHVGFLPLNREVPVYLDTAIRTGGDYGITVHVNNIPQTIAFVSSFVTIWGVPGDARHDETRGYSCLTSAVAHAGAPPCQALNEDNPPPFFELPTSCTGPLHSSVEVDSWENPGDFATGQNIATTQVQPLPAMDGCNRLAFHPEISVAPDGQEASTPSGLTVNVKVPQDESLNPKGLGEADIKDTTVALPEGITINPAGANGLEACSEQLVGYEPGVSEPPANLHFTGKLPSPLQAGVNFCPNASKVGTVRIKTPLLKNPLTGAVYLASQNANPFGSLVAMYIVAEDPESGVLVKLPGEVALNQQTGQIAATFLNTPQAPIEEAEFHFFGGERAPLATPTRCATYTTTTAITPWSGSEAAHPSSSFQITSGPNHSACPSTLPFTPSLTAGSINNQAGAFSPFTMTMSREDGNQNLKSIQLGMPPGLSGILAGIPLCGEAQANAGTCGAESELGETTVSVGLGGDPYTVKGGKVYLTGPYKGAPFGLSIVNPAVAGPYDLGKVIVRAKLDIDQRSAAVTVTSDATGPYAIPPSIDGIPLEIKHVNVTITRPHFTFNPTNCNPLTITGTLSSIEEATATLAVPFQATNCATLKFTPKIAVSTAAHASKANGASLHFKISYPTGPIGTQSWFQEAKFNLPKQLPARLTTLQKACLATVFETNPAACPPAATIGHAIVHTPVLPVPLTGPVYFVSYGGAKFPEAVILLQGYGVTIQLHGETFINKQGITSATFRNTPDVPFENIEVTIPTGHNSEFTTNLPPKAKYNLCGQKLVMPTLFKAQNGLETHQNTNITITGCKKPKHNKHHHNKHTHKHK
jgi:hypothetical protein